MINWLINLIKKFFRWLKRLLKKNKQTNNTVVKTKHPILKGSIDIIGSIVTTNIEGSNIKSILVTDIQKKIENLNKVISKLNEKQKEEKVREIKNDIKNIKLENNIKEIQAINNDLNKIIKSNKINESLSNIDDKVISVLNNQKKDDINIVQNDKQKGIQNLSNSDNKSLNQNIISNKEVIKDNVNSKEPGENIKSKNILDKKNKLFSLSNKQKDIEKVEINPVDNKSKKYKNYVVDSNSKLKIVKEELKEVKDGLKVEHSKDYYQVMEIKLDRIKQTVKEILKQYPDFKHNDYIYQIEQDFTLKELDKFEIIKSSENIDNYLKECEELLHKVKYNTTKKVLESPIVFATKKPEKEVKKEEIKQKEEKKPTSDIEKCKEIVNSDVQKQKRILENINEQIFSVPQPQQVRVRKNFFNNFLTNTIKIGLALTPLRIFRNKPLGLLLSGYILNNNIRTMRNIMNQTKVNYVEFNEAINSQISMIDNYNTLCSDSLYHLGCLKTEILTYYNINDLETQQVMYKINALENQILYKQQQLYNNKTKLKKAKVKVLEKQ